MIALYIFFKIILYILLVLVIVILAVLVIPFKYYVSAQKYEKVRAAGWVSWLFGSIKIRFNYKSDSGIQIGMKFLWFNKNLKDTKHETKPVSKEKTRPGRKSDKPAFSYYTYEVIKKGLQSILKILNHCRPKQFHLNVIIGFDDPMYTGLVCGIKNTGYAILDRYNIKLQTTFEDEVMEGSFIIGGGIQIFYLILVAIEFVLTRPFRSILLKNIKFKIKRRLKRWRIISVSTKA